MTGNRRSNKFSTSEIERMANELLSKAAKSLPWDLKPPVPVEDILEKHLHLTLEAMPVGDGSCLGAISIKKATVWYQEDLDRMNLGCFSFTLAHEIGHWQMHRPQVLLEQEIPMSLGALWGPDKPDRDVSVDIICRDGSKEPREVEANTFAACLLMPEKLVCQAFARLFPGGLDMPVKAMKSDEARLDWINYHVTHHLVAKDGGGFTNCSRMAMNYRVKNMGLVNTSGTARLL